MQAIVMAGGEGTRLRPITEGLPKPFVRVAGRPTIEYVLERLREAGISEVILAVCYKPLPIIERLEGGAALGMRLFYSLEDEPLGTAGGVKRCAGLLRGTTVVASGDVLADVDIAALVKFHRDRGAIATMALTRVEDPSEFGVVDIAEDGRVRRFQEKPKREEAFSNLVNAGIYVLEPEVLGRIPDGSKFDFSRDLFPALLKEGAALFAAPVDGFWMDVGRPADLLLASDVLAERRYGRPYVHPEAAAAKTARVEATHRYAGSSVEDEAQVTNSILYDRSRVGRGAVVRGSILCDGARVGDGATVEDCILGAGAAVPAGARVRELRVPGGETAGAE